MLCRKPFMLGVMPCGCGQCMPCRINRRRLWTSRLLMESVKAVGSCFVTLTYGQENMPEGASLVPKECQDWLKRIRMAVDPVRLRYFLVGEYGDQTDRPHYHAALFGIDALGAGGDDGRGGVVRETWGKGHTFVGELTPESAGYVAGYVTKKMTKKDDGRLNGRFPEFARMSLRPGIGAGAMEDFAVALRSSAGDLFVNENGDVPSSYRSGRSFMPLGRYLRRVLRKKLGGSGDAPSEAVKKYSLALRVLYESEAALSPEKSLRQIYLKKYGQEMTNREVRAKIGFARRVL